LSVPAAVPVWDPAQLACFIGRSGASLLECLHCMADWKQITARIRRARTGKDPVGQLSNLFAKTRDAMVAFELARYLESTGNAGDAGRWYLTAAERFRRADWKTKAQESATRLGATEPAEVPPVQPKAAELQTVSESQPAEEAEAQEAQPEPEAMPAEPQPEASAERKAPHGGPGQRHRRGRRGRESQRPSRRGEQGSSHRDSRPTGARHSAPAAQTEEEAPAAPERPSRASLEESVEVSVPSLRGRYGDPGLSSRLSQLEMNFRRLLACTPTKLEDANHAPAGPGVWLLTDSDLTTYYYVEACQTLRVAIPNLVRGGTSKRGGESIKPKLAEHLGIAESRVSKYLQEHCVARWLQMDDGASYFAHFLVAVLRPTLNE
jgi:hypothetical protein